MKLLNSVTNVSVVGDNISVAKVDGSTSTVTVPYANTSRTLERTARIDARGKTIRQFKDEIMNVIGRGSFPWGAIGYIEIVGNVDAICPNLNDDNFVINASNATPSIVEVNNPVSFSETNYRGILVFYSCSGNTYRAYIMDCVFHYVGKYVYEENNRNTADAWEMQSGELIIDAHGTSADQIIIGNMALNYNGNGFKYVFKNGKGQPADLYAGNVYGNVKGKTDVINTIAMTNIDTPSANDSYTTSIEYTSSSSIDNGRKWYTLISSRLTNDKTQIGIPVISSIKRVIVRGQSDVGNNPITTPFREIPYLDEVVTLTGISTVTGTLNVPTQTVTDNSDKVASTAFVQAAIAEALKAKGL